MAVTISTATRNRLLGNNQEEIINGAFTSTTTGWTSSNATLTSAGSGQNGNCLSIAETGGASAGKAYQDVTVTPGHYYRFSYWFKKGTADNGKAMLGTTATEDLYYDSGNLSDAAWTNYWRDILVPASITTVRITLQSNDATAAETSFFDTVTFYDLAGAIRDIFHLGFLKIYSGSKPTSADDAPTGTHLVTFSDNSGADGLQFAVDASSGSLTKLATQTWSGIVANSGTAGYARLQTREDSGGSSTTDARIDCQCGTSGVEIIMSSTSLTAAAVETMNSFSIVMPAS
jgi:hypothetical protein